MVLLVGMLFLRIDRIHAQETAFVQPTQCSDSQNYIETYVVLEPGLYSVLIPESIPSESKLFINSSSENCQEIDAISAKAYTVPLADLYVLQLYLPANADMSIRQSIILKDTSDNQLNYCTDTAGCDYEFQNRTGKIVPKRLSSYFDSLDLYLYESAIQSDIKNIVYAIDGQKLYETSSLEEFNKNYVPPGEHKLQTKVELDSGQYILFESTEKLGTSGDLFLLTRSWVFRNKSILTYIVIGMMSILVLVILQIVHIKFVQKQNWRAAHIATSQESKHSLAGGRLLRNDSDSSLGALLYLFKIPALIVVGLFILSIILNSYVVSPIRTDGESMTNTLKDRQQLVVSRLARTISKVRGDDYVPRRGDIIIFNKSHEGAEGALEEESLLVKRVIGLPGDTVNVTPDKIIVTKGDDKDSAKYIDTEQPWFSTVRSSQFNGNLTVKLAVGELFVAGDNRDGSIDSRFFGPIQAEDIFGRVIRAL